MKHTMTIFVFIGLLLSCNSTDKKTSQDSHDMETVTNSIPQETQQQLLAIDTDEALIATALMAAPAESRASCKVIGNQGFVCVDSQ